MKFGPLSISFERKTHPAGAAFFTEWGKNWVKGNDARAFVKEGYQQNVVVYAAVQEIAGAVATLDIEAKEPSGKALDKHPALDLLARPNPVQGWPSLARQMFIDYSIHGEMSVVRNPVNSAAPPTELWHVSPSNVTVEPGRGGMPSKYVHKVGAIEREFPVRRTDGRSDMFFMKRYNPDNYWRGQSPLVAAGLAADTHNAGMLWNYRMLQNGARPPGLIRMMAGVSGDSIAKAKEYFKRQITGYDNAGEIPMLPEGMEWEKIGGTPQDMDFMNTQKEAAKLIARAFGVPLPLIDNDSSTFNNIAEAKVRFYTDTVLPLFDEFLEHFSNWLMPYYGTPGVRLCVDMDKVPALEPLRSTMYDRMVKATGNRQVLTQDEARGALGWEPVGGSAGLLDPLGSLMGDGLIETETEEALRKQARLAYGAPPV